MFDYDTEKLKGFPTASITVQGVKPMLLSRSGASAPWVLSAPAAGRKRLESRPPLFPSQLGRDQSEKKYDSLVCRVGTGGVQVCPKRSLSKEAGLPSVPYRYGPTRNPTYS